MGTIADRSRQQYEARMSPVLSSTLEPGEREVASGLALSRRSWWKRGLFGVLARPGRQYWVVTTDRRLILIRIRLQGGDEVERSESLSRVRLIGAGDRGISYHTRLEIGEDTYRLDFIAPFKSDAKAIVSALGNDT
jgi:hypothetical protein